LFRKPSSADANRLNFYYLYADILWFGITAGSTLNFLAIYLTRLGASSLQIGLLTAGPAAIQLLFSLPVGRSLTKLPVIRATYTAAFLQRLGHVFLIFLPWFLSEDQQIWVILLIVLIGSVPGTVLMIGFNAMLADLVPVSLRGTVIGRRNALLAISLTVSTLVCGYILDRVAFPLNYQIVFLLGGISAVMSTYQITRLRYPDRTPERVNQPLGEMMRPGMKVASIASLFASGLRFLRRGGARRLLPLDLLRTPFGSFMLAYLVFYFAQYVGIPLYPPYMVRDLGLKDSQISLGFVFFYLTMFLGSLQIHRISRRWGHRGVLVAGGMLFSLYPFLFYLAKDASLYYLASILGGFVWALVSAGLLNRLMERVPEDERPQGMALHNLVMNTGILSGSLTGPLVGNLMGLQPALFVSGLLRLAAGFVLLRWG
jgi:MFS family permease